MIPSLIAIVAVTGWILTFAIFSTRLRACRREALRAATDLRDRALPEYSTIRQAQTIAEELAEPALDWIARADTEEIAVALETRLHNNSDFFGVWFACEPGVIAGRSDHFSHYVYREKDRTAAMEIPDVGAEEFYRRPLRDRTLSVLEPFEYELDGRAVLMTAVAAPVFRDGEVVGVCGVDVRLRRSATLNIDLLHAGTRTKAIGRTRGRSAQERDRAKQGARRSRAEQQEFELLQAGITAVSAEFDAFRELFNNLSSVEQSIRERNGVTREVVDYISSAIEEIRTAADSQVQESEESEAVIEQISGNIGSLESLIEEQSSMVEEASSTIEEMVANIHSLQQTLDSNAERFTALDEQSQLGTRSMAEVDTLVREISSDSASLGEANKTVQAIAAQTNLLAMNAAIEAAHAGDAGRGFAVVADEIRKLAANASTQSRTISDNLKNVTTKIEQCVEASGASQGAIHRLAEIVNEVHNRESEITAAMKEQAAGSDEVTSALRRMVDVTTQVSGASKEMSQGREQMVRSMNSIGDTNKSLKSKVDGIATRKDELAATFTELSAASDRMSQVIFEGGVGEISE